MNFVHKVAAWYVLTSSGLWWFSGARVRIVWRLDIVTCRTMDLQG